MQCSIFFWGGDGVCFAHYQQEHIHSFYRQFLSQQASLTRDFKLLLYIVHSEKKQFFFFLQDVLPQEVYAHIVKDDLLKKTPFYGQAGAKTN